MPRITESETRYNIVDPLLKQAGWNLADRTQVGFEIPVAGYDNAPIEGFTDYCLYRADGEILAVIEAKRTSRDARVGEQQALQYATGIEKSQSFRPFIFLTNGDDIFFRDSELSASRRVAGFFTRENFEHFNMMPKEGDGKSSIPVLVSIFNTRLQKLSYFLGDQSCDDARRIISDLRADITRIPLKSFSVKKVFKEVRDAWEDEFWNYLTPDKLEFLRLKVAPLLRFAPDVKPSKEFFTSKMERCGLALLQKKPLKPHIDSIREDVSLLPTNLPEIAAHRSYIDAVLGNEFWSALTLAKLDEWRSVLAPLMRYRRERPSTIIELGLDDIIDSRKWVILKKDSERMYVEEYRKKVEQKILEIAASHPAIVKLQQGGAVSHEDLVRLEETLETVLQSDEISLDDENMLKAFGVRVGSLVDFLKHILHIEALPSYETVVHKAFDAFVLEHNYNADQSRFLRAVQSVFLQRRKLETADLYEEPFTNFGMNAVEKLFSQNEITELIEMTKGLAA